MINLSSDSCDSSESSDSSVSGDSSDSSDSRDISVSGGSSDNSDSSYKKTVLNIVTKLGKTTIWGNKIWFSR